MTPRQRVEAALAGRRVDKVPFTMYNNFLPPCSAEREMRNRGLCIVMRKGVFQTHRPNVRVRQEVTYAADRSLHRTFYETPCGTLSSLTQPVGFTTWTHEHLFHGRDDYKALRFFIEDEQYEPCYADFVQAERDFGQDGIFRAAFGLEPLQSLISGEMIAMQDFCIEWMERRDEILALYEAMVAKRRRIYPLVACGPAGHANYGGNVVPEVIGPEVFGRYYLPHYQEAAEIMHRHGKRIGTHFDANCRVLAGQIAQSGLDYIEAFTPAPDTDMDMAAARAAWPEKVLWINFPSSVHLRPDAEVAQTAYDLIEASGGPQRLIIGITEDMPDRRWQDSCRAIMDGIDRHAAEHPGLYE